MTTAKVIALIKALGGSGGGGSGGGVLVVTDTDGTLDKTAGEIMTAFASGITPVVVFDYGEGEMEVGTLWSGSVAPDSGYYFAANIGGNIAYSAATASDYPQSGNGGGGGN